MKVLVTGGAGYIGSHTCVELIEAGHQPIVLDNLCNSNPESLRRVAQITGCEIPFIEGDVCDEALLHDIFSRNSDIDCVIHFAGLKAVGESVSMPLEYYYNNLVSTMALARVMGQHGVKKIIFSSSASDYLKKKNQSCHFTALQNLCELPFSYRI